MLCCRYAGRQTLSHDWRGNVRANYPKLDRQRKVKFFGNDTNIDGVLLRLLVHNHEHMGQSIANARSIGVVPSWSAGQ